MQNQRYDEARRWFHYIFDPRHSDGDGPARFWKIKPFYEAQLAGPTETLQELLDLLDEGSTALEQQVAGVGAGSVLPGCDRPLAHLRLHAGDRQEIPRLPDPARRHAVPA